MDFVAGSVAVLCAISLLVVQLILVRAVYRTQGDDLNLSSEEDDATRTSGPG